MSQKKTNKKGHLQGPSVFLDEIVDLKLKKKSILIIVEKLFSQTNKQNANPIES